MQRPVQNVSCDEDEPRQYLWLLAAKALVQLNAADARHLAVAEHDVVAILLQQICGDLAVFGEIDGKAALGQQTLKQLAHARFVVGDERSTSPQLGPCVGVGSPSRLGRLLNFRHRQGQPEAGADRSRGECQRTTVRLGNSEPD